MTNGLKNSFLLELSTKVIPWAEQAGQIALRFFKDVTIEYKADQTLVTQADRDIEALLVENIQATYPDHRLIAEEGSKLQVESDSPYTWVIDPLDGTTVFVRGLPGWGISIGLLYNLKPIFGLFYMPLLNDLTYTKPDQAICQGKALGKTVQADWTNKGFLTISSSTHYDFKIDLPRTRSLGSAGASLIYTARGSATAAFIPKAHLWDLVPGAAILSRTGGELRYLSGQSLSYADLYDGKLIPEPIIAGHPQILDELTDSITPR